MLAASPGWAADYTVNSEAELAAAITAANATAESDTITLGTDITLTAALPSITDAVTIDGGGFALTGSGSDRIFFVDAAGDSVAIANFSSISGGSASGGDGGDNLGGGGLGAGGAIYINQGDVTVTNVSFTDNGATGGDGGSWTDSSSGGGGGGLGGDGGDGGEVSGTAYGGGGGGGGYDGGGGGGGGTAAYTTSSYSQTSGGTGGVDIVAGGNGYVSGAGAAGFGGGAGGAGDSYSDPGYTTYTYVPGYYSPGYCYYSFWGGSYCYSGYYYPGYSYSYYVPGTGDHYAGGGGGGGGTGGGAGGDGYVSGYYQAGGGGGGGGGLSGTGGSGTANGDGGDGTYGGGGAGSAGGGTGGDGGTFGGGGGGYLTAGAGGFGGGGGGSMVGTGGAGGFGGGGGGSVFNSAGVGGFGAGSGSSGVNDTTAGGGGGAGLGGAIFVGDGGSLTIGGNVDFTGSTASGGGAGGTSATAGIGAGSDLFLRSGTMTTLAPGAGNTIALSGTIGDDSSWTLDRTVGGGGAGATLAVNGGGTVEMSGTSTIAGGFTVDGATLHVTDTGLVTAPGVAVELVGAGAVLDNDGTIEGATVAGASSDPLDISATVLVSAAGEIDNDGTIYAAGNSNVAAIRADADLTLVNGGAINSWPASGAFGVLGTNSVSILTIDNQASGIIEGGAGAVITAGAIDLTNSGMIESISGIGVSAGSGAIENQAGASIFGTTGVVITGGGLFDLVSGGNIAGSGGTAISVTGGGTITLGSSSVTFGNVITGASGTVTTTLGGLLTGNLLGGAAEDNVTLLTTFVLAGTLDGGAGIDSLTFGGSGSGTYDISTPLGFEHFTVDVEGDWTFTGNDNSIANWTIADGTAKVGAGGINSGASVDMLGDGAVELTGNLEVGSIAGESGTTIALGAFALTAGGNATNTEFAGSISGTDGSLVKTGTGTLTLSGTNSYTGLTSIEGGILSLANGAAVDDSADVEIATGATLDLQDSETIGSLSGDAGSLVTLNANTLTTGGNDSATIFEGIISGSGGLTQDGVGSLMLTGANTYTGATTVSRGTLTLGGPDVLSDSTDVTVASGAALDLLGNDEAVSSLDIAGSLLGTGTLTASTYTLDGATIDANLGSGLLENSGGTSILDGIAGAETVLVSGGTLQLGAGERLADSAGLTVDTGASFNLQGYDETVGSAAIAGTLSGTGTLTASTYTLDGATIDANLGAGILNVQGGTSTLNGTSGASEVNLVAGTLRLGGDNRLLTTTDLAIASGVTLDLQSFDQDVATAYIAGILGGTGTLTAATYTLEGGTVDANLGGGILNVVGGVSVLNGTSGASEVNLVAGTLRLGGDQRLLGTTDLSIGSGFTLDLQSHDQDVATAYIAGILDGTGTLTAPSYTLEGATVNADLGEGAIENVGGTSVLSGSAASSSVLVSGGTLQLGASERLADSADLVIAGGAILDLQDFDESVGTAAIAGTLAGTGTLTAATYGLDGATIDANLGAGSLDNSGGTSLLYGTADADEVLISGGTLQLGADERLSDTLVLDIGEAGSFDLAGNGETLGGLSGAGQVVLGEAGNAGTLTILSTEDSEYAGAITGTGDVIKDGEAKLILTGDSAFDGTMTIQQGLLTVDGSLLADIVVEQGGMLGGNGAIGSLDVLGTLSPGNSIGQIAVNGDLSFGAGSVYTVEVNPALESDRTDVTGTVTISPDASVEVIAEDGNYQPSSTYRILTADGGISGQFGSVETNLAFLDPNLVYSAEAVDLQLVRNDIDFSQYATSANQVSAAGAVQELGAGNPLFDSVVKLSAEEAPAAFMQLSGEAYASVLSGMTQSSLQIRDKMLERSVEGDGLQLWGDIVGTWGKIKARHGIAESKSMNRYLIAGADFQRDAFRFGVAGGLLGGDFDSDKLGSMSDLDSQFIGLSGAFRRGPVELKAGAEWTWHDVSTTRSVSFGGMDETENGRFSGDTQQLFVEGSFELSKGPSSLQPFGRFASVITHSDGFGEMGGNAALAVQAGRQNVRLLTVGVRLNGNIPSMGGTLTPNLRVGWQHGWGDLDSYSTASFAEGHGFLFQGAQLAKDAADIHAGFDWTKGRLRLGLSYSGFLSRSWTEHGAALELAVGF